MTVPNGGPAKARNLALDAVPEDAEYIMFADSDDLLESDALEYALTEGRGADLVLMGFSIKNTDGSTAAYYEAEQHLDPSTLGAELGRLYKANLLNQVWAKLFSAAMIKEGHIRFPDYRWGEDRLFIFDCLERAGSVAVLPECKYSYIMHPGQSLISSYYDKKFEVCLGGRHPRAAALPQVRRGGRRGLPIYVRKKCVFLPDDAVFPRMQAQPQ